MPRWELSAFAAEAVPLDAAEGRGGIEEEAPLSTTAPAALRDCHVLISASDTSADTLLAALAETLGDTVR